LSPHWRNINVNDLLGLCVVDGTEVQRESILGVINVRAIVHESLLQPDPSTETFVETNCPR
jgi:hypothetical protein